MNFMEILLHSGADVNLFDNVGETALMCAAKRGYDRCVEMLINAGADVNVRQHVSGSKFSALEYAAKAGSEICVKLLIEAGADVEAKSATYSALMLAAASGNESCVEQLINAGANVDRQSQDRMTALMFAAKGGHHQYLKKLVKKVYSETLEGYVSNIDRQDKNGFLSLDVCSQRWARSVC